MAKKQAMVAPVPAKIPQPKNPIILLAELSRLGGGRPFVVVDEKPEFILVMFLGDSKPTKIMK
jgi:hypothetical protein